ncbi:hypothetical protein GQ54DRAFT_337323 [Martensiomyces pterosporus]|nr:hypothetical protein GQ54DRAFT_337323 [Martensiomyces pterosporus]
MDEVLATLKNEITLDCEEGSSLDQIWRYVEQAQRAIAERSHIDTDGIAVDGAMKQYLWPYISQLEGVIFKDGPATIYDSTDPSGLASEAANGFLNLSFEEVAKRYPNIVVRASQPAINKVLFGREEGLAKVIKSAFAYKILQMLARAREKGLTQAQLAKDLNVDPRSNFHYIKTLDKQGLVVKFATFDNGSNTNLVLLRKFANTDPQISKPAIPSNRDAKPDAPGGSGGEVGEGEGEQGGNGKASNEVANAAMSFPPGKGSASDVITANLVRNRLRKRVSDLLETSATGYMVETDLMDVLGLDIWNTRHRKYFHRVTRDLTASNYIECVRMQVPDESFNGSNAVPEEQAAEQGANEGGAAEGDAAEGDAAPEASRGAKQKAKRDKNGKRIRSNAAKRHLNLLEGHSIRRCIRFIKPYRDKRGNNASLGVPMGSSKDNSDVLAASLQSSKPQQERASIGGQGTGQGAEFAADDVDIEEEEGEEEDDDSSDDEIPNVEAIKEKADIMYMLSKPQVRIGVIRGLSLEVQMFRLISLAGTHGIVAKALQFLLQEPNFKIVARYLVRLERSPVVLAGDILPGVYYPPGGAGNSPQISETEMLVTAVEEFMGREHRKRYFVNPCASNIASLIAIDSIVPSSDLGAPPQRTTSSSVPASRPAAEVGQENGGAQTKTTAHEPAAEQPAKPASKATASADAGAQAESSTAAGGQTPMNTAAPSGPASQPDSWSNIEDVLGEASRRGLSLNALLREDVILKMLEDETIIGCTVENVIRCEKLIKEYLAEKRAAGAIPASVVESAMKHTLDKRTFLRTVNSLANQDRLWARRVVGMPVSSARNVPSSITVAIARSADPDGPMVDSFISLLRDRRAIHSRTALRWPRLIKDVIPVTRTDGAEDRDREYKNAIRETLEARALSVTRTVDRMNRLSATVDSGMRKRRGDPDSLPLSKRVRVGLVGRGQDEIDDPDWASVLKRVMQYPKKFVRIMRLYEFLVETLPHAVDMQRVYQNYCFRPSYFFYEMPLCLYLELCGGITHFPAVRRYIRYGVSSSKLHLFDDNNTRSDQSDLSGSDDSEGKSSAGKRWRPGTLEEMNARLATPISKLPETLFDAFRKYFGKSRMHFQPLIYAMVALQLLRPISTVKELMSTPPPGDAKDIFASAPSESPRCLSLGYQLIGRTRILGAEGVMNATADCKQGPNEGADLTTSYYDDEVYDMLDSGGRFKYWGNLELTGKETGKGLPISHTLYGIDKFHYWRVHVTLTTRQMEVLNTFTNRSTYATPLGKHDILLNAAAQAGVTPTDARSYFQHVRANWESRDRKRTKANAKRLKSLEARKLEAKNARDMADTRLKKRKSRVQWNEDESILVAIAYVVLRHHARSHEHVFTIKPIGNLFPKRAHTRKPIDAVRHHWIVMQQHPHYKALAAGLDAVWKHVFADAMEKGLLEDDEDIDRFDLCKAAFYLRDLLQDTPVEALLDRYAQEISEDRNRVVDVKTLREGLRKKRPVRKPKGGAGRLRSTRKSKGGSQTNAGDADARSKQPSRLPATMEEFLDRYIVEAGDARPKIRDVGGDFPEDIFKEGMASRAQQKNALNAMITTHQDWKCMSDYSSPVATFLATRAASQQPEHSPDGMDVDSSQEKPKVKRELIASDAPAIAYTEAIGSLHPIERTLDADRMVERINAVSQNSSSIDDGQDGLLKGDENQDATTGHASDINMAKIYVAVASLQPMITNLILTPEDEYDVETGHKLLHHDADMSSRAITFLNRYLVINKLKSLAVSVGLRNHEEPEAQNQQGLDVAEAGAAEAGVPEAGTAEAVPDEVGKSDEPTEEPEQRMPSALPPQGSESTVVVYETTGTTRINARAAAIGSQVAETPRAEAAGEEQSADRPEGSEGEGKNGDNSSQQDNGDDSFDPRKVPGRGLAVGERFLAQLRGTLPLGFIKRPAIPMRGYAKLGELTESGDMAFMLSLIARCRVWIRPAYNTLTDTYIGGLSGLKKQPSTDVIDFDLKVLADPTVALDVSSTRKRGRSTENKGLRERETGLSQNNLAAASRIAAAAVDLAGPLGVTVDELGAIFSRLLGVGSARIQVSEDVRSALISRERLAALLRLLVNDTAIHDAGSTDRRYVSDRVYRQFWARTIEGVPTKFVPHLGQNLSGSVNTAYFVSILTALFSRILDNPGITQMKLMRRFFAPYIPKSEILRYLDMLADLGIIYSHTAEVGEQRPHMDPIAPTGITSYWVCPDYYLNLLQLPESRAVTSPEFI